MEENNVSKNINIKPIIIMHVFNQGNTLSE